MQRLSSLYSAEAYTQYNNNNNSNIIDYKYLSV